MKRKWFGWMTAVLLCALFVCPLCAADISPLGEKTTVGNITYYTDEEGRASAPISASGITWVRAEYEGIKTWFGIGNAVGVPENAIFRVRIINRNDVSDGYYSRIQDTKRASASGDDRYIDMQITDADGTIYTGSLRADFYVELGDEFDMGDMEELFEGEPVSINIQNRLSLGTQYIDVAQISYGTRNTGVSSESSKAEINQSGNVTKENSSIGWQIAAVAEAAVIIGLIIFIVIDKQKKK